LDEQVIIAAPTRRGRPPGNSAPKIKTDWRCAAAAFVTRVRAKSGVEITDLIQHTKIRVLMKKETWERIKRVDSTLSVGIYGSAIWEMRRLFSINVIALSESDYTEAKKICAHIQTQKLQAKPRRQRPKKIVDSSLTPA
jgi:hypothetical protein